MLNIIVTNGYYEPSQRNKWYFILEKKTNQLKIWTPIAPTMPTRHGRVHANVFMAQRPLHELLEGCSSLGTKNAECFQPIAIECLPTDLALSWLVRIEAGLVRTNELHG